MKNLEICLQALQVGKYEKEIVLRTVAEIENCSLQDLSANRKLVADVFFQLLQYCQKLYDTTSTLEELKDPILNTLKNIEQISTEATEEEKSCSSVTILWFLHELKTHGALGTLQYVDDTYLQDKIYVLLEELEKIYFIFEIQEAGKYVFPIHDMLQKVITNPEFVDVDNPLGEYQIHILQLAVRLFKTISDKPEIFRTLTEDCNLKFINYLQSTGDIIDTQDLLNHQKNGVMIFYDRGKNSVLIRNKNSNYFTSSILFKKKDLKIEIEKDYHENLMGYFIEYKLDEGDTLVDYSDILKDEHGRQEFLKLVYDKGIYNILLENSLIKKVNGDICPINPFCYKDKVFVKGKLNSIHGKAYIKEEFIDALSSYRNSSLKKSRNNVLNRVSFGLALLLLERENIGVDNLKLNSFGEDEWYQEQLLKNWVKSCRSQIDAVMFIVEEWYKQNAYCIRRTNTSKCSSDKSIENHDIEVLDFYPLRDKCNWIYKILGVENTENAYVLIGRVQEDEEETILVGDVVFDYWGKTLQKETGIRQLIITKENIKDPDNIFLEGLEVGELEYYFLYDAKKQKAVIYENKFLKNFSKLVEILEKNGLDWEITSKVTLIRYKEIYNKMKLQQEALDEVGKKFFSDFDSQVYYRLIHNMIWSNVNENTVESYLKIFEHHQQLEFSEISKDEKFMRKDENTLYVPKDGRRSDSVLSSIYEKYLKSKSIREKNDLFDDSIELKNDKYYHNGKCIKKIVFLSDNFEKGGSTKRMIKAYLNMDISHDSENEQQYVRNAKERSQKYYMTDKTGNKILVDIDDIVEKNSCSLEIHAYYGTKEGLEEIKQFLVEKDIKNLTVSYGREIIKKESQINDELQRLGEKWKRANSDVYTVIREFNMTKGNVFPEEMLINPQKSICMFVKKKEVYS